MNNINNCNLKSFSSLVGNTPLLEIHLLYKGEPRIIYAKAENFNLTGSIKDRMAYNIYCTAYENGLLKKDYKVAEATSGNTGISIAAIGSALGHDVTIFMPDWMSVERKNIIKSYGATIVSVTKEQGGFLGSIELAENMTKENEQVFLPRQFSNKNNIAAHYNSTGPEIWWQLKYRNIEPDAFIAGVGTGGTIMGVGQFLKEKNAKIKVHPLEPSNSPTLTTGHKVGKHRIQGISDEFIPSIVDLNYLDEIVCVDDGDSIIMAQKLASRLGLGVGISSGANLLGALKVQEQLGKDAVVVTIFSDDNKKYLSTDLLKEEEVKDGFISTDVELQMYRAIKRVCHTCCNPAECFGNKKESVPFADEFKLPHCPRRRSN